MICLLKTTDADEELDGEELGGRRNINKTPARRPGGGGRICDASAAAIGANEAKRIAEFDEYELEVA